MTALAAASYLQLAASLVLFGAALFPAYAKSAVPWRVLRWSAAAALLFGVAAVLLQSQRLDATLAQLMLTGIGRVWAAQIALAAVLCVAATMRARIAAIAAIAALNVTLFALVGHANAIAGWPGAAVEALHLLAAGGWIGGLVALLLALRAEASPELAQRFSAAGLCFVLVIGVTGAATLWQITGAALPMTAFGYGRLVSGKIALFAAALALAAFNRIYATPRSAWGALRNSVAVEVTLLAFVIALAVALAGTEPLA